MAARRLADLLAERGDLDGAEQLLRTLADNGDTMAAKGLAGRHDDGDHATYSRDL
jgi:hypothetical protein